MGLLVLGLAYSLWGTVPLTLRVMDAEGDAYASISRHERAVTYLTRMQMPVDLFQWYSEQLEPGDRYYVHGAPGGFGQFADLRTVVRAIGRLYFLPAVEVDDPRAANVIVSWQADPATLGLRFSGQVQAGAQPYFVSRVAGAR